MRQLSIAIITAGVISGLMAACSSSSGPSASHASTSSAAALSCPPARAPAPGSSGDPLARLTGAEIIRKARADAYAAATLCVSEPARLRGIGLTVPSIAAVMLGSTERCKATVTTPGGGAATLTAIGNSTWVMANRAYARNVKGSTPETVSAASGKYVTAPHEIGAIGAVFTTCQDATMPIYNMTGLGPYHLIAGITKVDGQPAVTVTDSANDSWYISDTPAPLPLRVVVATGNTVIFSSFGARFIIKPPSASQVLDGSKYGF